MNDDVSALRNRNPYGGVPTDGITLALCDRPTPDLVSSILY